MRALGIWLVALTAGFSLAGCGADEVPVAASDGERIGAALKSADVTSVRCMGSKEYGPGQEMPKGFEPEHAGSDSVSFLANSGSQKPRSSDFWGAKVPVWVKIGSEPIEVAVLDYEGQPRSRLQYSQRGEPNDENTSTRVRFLPCGDKKPTWRGYPGVIVSDADPDCVTVVEQVAGQIPRVIAVPLNGKCVYPGEAGYSTETR